MAFLLLSSVSLAFCLKFLSLDPFLLPSRIVPQSDILTHKLSLSRLLPSIYPFSVLSFIHVAILFLSLLSLVPQY